jgi:hypothetical protein
MGFFAHKTSTWRAPLQTIDSVLPSRAARSPLAPVIALCLHPLRRTGWLAPASKRPSATPATPPRCGVPEGHDGTARAGRPIRIIHAPDQALAMSRRPCPRVVISGRMADVCAELERLAAMEARMGHA